jgi:hypothetical protein
MPDRLIPELIKFEISVRGMSFKAFMRPGIFRFASYYYYYSRLVKFNVGAETN